MKVEQFRYSADNLAYLVHSGGRGVAIDGGAADQIIEFAREHAIRIVYVTNTHLHADHTTGNAVLLKKTKAEYIDCAGISSDQSIVLKDETLLAFPSPGHTADDVCFSGSGFIITGDTLFNGTVGNCFSGDLEAFYHSLKRLMDFPAETQIYSGHDYVAQSMVEARMIEPENPEIDAFLARYSPDRVVSALADEFKVNPYLRFNSPEIIETLKQRGLYQDSALGRFKTLMEVY